MGWLRDNPVAADALLACLLLAIALPYLWVTPSFVRVEYRQADLLGVAVTVIATVPMAWRRRSPLPSLVLAGTAAVGLEVAGYGSGGPAALGVLIGLYTVAAHCDRRQSVIAAGYVAIGLAVIVGTSPYDVNLGDVLTNVVIFATAWVLGDNVRTRRAYVAGLEDRSSRLEREREEQARQAVADERARIARELHDVVAHNVSVVTVQAGAARRILRSDPERAAEALAAIELTGRQALAEMRRLLGVLRPEDAASEALAPQPSVADVGVLVEQVRDAGLAVDLEVEGPRRDLPSGVDLSAYRIVQEALTNTLKHAGPARARVVVRYGTSALELEVSDDGRGMAEALAGVKGAGHGLVGMRERVALYGGQLSAGPLRGGGYLVRASLPLDGPAT